MNVTVTFGDECDGNDDDGDGGDDDDDDNHNFIRHQMVIPINKISLIFTQVRTGHA